MILISPLHVPMDSSSASAVVEVTISPIASVVPLTPGGSFSWLGLLGKLVLFALQTATIVLYWLIKLTTISAPSFLFTLFSMTLTFSMNATTL